ncbi:MAG: tRNA preQ1(34) S-adenosylmethionine ribosyltransferase-isomerase QueA [Verrucomicrobiae bacterium]|nr:tRNA preQ1(34) S-adenosylmethionine ribosyltransferase-isomerase QueA [Verrucomicrobiae bacterium]
MSYHLSDYDYALPPELVASRPVERREDSRMLVLHRESGRMEHRFFKDLPEYIAQEDLLVLNDSKVLPARLHDVLGKVEMLLVKKQDETHWIAMVKPGRKMRPGNMVTVGDVEITVQEILPDGMRLLALSQPLDLERWGEMPIPSYFKREADAEDCERYQSVFARDPGSVAAPTAGLHFTKAILQTLPHAFLTLHVGPGTFLPVKTENVSEHTMHREEYQISAATAVQLNDFYQSEKRGRLIAVGTTTVRVLESQPEGPILPHMGATNIFIRPPYQFQRVDALLTNFHFPKSTLLMLISALAGRETILETYRTAVKQGYRFYSYGDCMLIL